MFFSHFDFDFDFFASCVKVMAFDAEKMSEETVEAVQPIISQPFFNYDVMKSKSQVAAYLTNWVINIVEYNKIYKKVRPLMDSLAEASESKSKAEAALVIVQERVREVQGNRNLKRI
eukprot:GHVT01102398.1.p1 GENE.GHVT01102398.1~~GHVT01102398.1.p1  ORF type:complete len:117 (+),score=16.06 GHVT01102398.1:199-549(+)